MGLFSWFSRKRDDRQAGGSDRGRSRAPRTSNAEVNAALQRLDGSPASIAAARQAIGAANLPNAERAEAFRAINASVGYRNQRDNGEDGDVMCNMTSMAMAMNGLGMGVDESKGQYENQLDRTRARAGLSRYQEGDREALAERIGADATTLKTPAFTDGAAAKAWYMERVFPRMANGATATFGIEGGNGRGGRFRHVVRLEWVEDKGLRIDDPFGGGVAADAAGNVGYRALNDTKGQGGVGENGFLSWDQVATLNRNKYVQLYTTRSPQPRRS